MTRYINDMRTQQRPLLGNLGRQIALLCCALGLLSACRGEPSRKPPVHPNQNMDLQDKYKPQRVSNFFKDILVTWCNLTKLKFLENLFEGLNIQIALILNIKKLERLLNCIKILNLR